MADIKVAAILPHGAKRESYKFVDVKELKNFNPKNCKDFVFNKLYKHKTAKDEKYSLVYVLGLAASKKDLKAHFAVSRIHYPSQRDLNFQEISADEERTSSSQKSAVKAAQLQGKLKMASRIMKQHNDRIKKQLSNKSNPKKDGCMNVQSLVKDSSGSSATTGQLSKENNAGKDGPVNFRSHEVSSESSASISKEQLKSVYSALPSSRQTVNIASVGECANPFGDIQSACKEMMRLHTEVMKYHKESETNLNQAKAYSENAKCTVAAIEKQFEKEREDLKALKEKLLAERRDMLRDHHQMLRDHDDMQQKIKDFESLSLSKTNQSACTSSAGNSRSTIDESPPHFPSSTLIDVGHGVEVDADFWHSAKETTTKEDWAYLALMAVFGNHAKYYRVRKPRKADPNLKLFPTSPPVLDVLQHYYKQWLRTHPAVVDERPPEKKTNKPSSEEEYSSDSDCENIAAGVDARKDREWKAMLDAESSEDREKRRRKTIDTLVKKLGGVLGDKAGNLYRQGTRSAPKKSREQQVNRVEPGQNPSSSKTMDRTHSSPERSQSIQGNQSNSSEPILIRVPHTSDIEAEDLHTDEQLHSESPGKNDNPHDSFDVDTCDEELHSQPFNSRASETSFEKSTDLSSDSDEDLSPRSKLTAMALRKKSSDGSDVLNSSRNLFKPLMCSTEKDQNASSERHSRVQTFKSPASTRVNNKDNGLFSPRFTSTQKGQSTSLRHSKPASFQNYAVSTRKGNECDSIFNPLCTSTQKTDNEGQNPFNTGKQQNNPSYGARKDSTSSENDPDIIPSSVDLED